MISPPRDRAIQWAHIMTNDPSVVVVDLETTGLGGTAEICDIAIVAMDGTVLMDQFVRPLRGIPAQAAAIHGISNDMVADAPTWPAIATKAMDLMANRTVIIYNASYDTRIIRQQCAEHQIATPYFLARCAMLEYGAFDGTPGRYGKGFKWHQLGHACTAMGIVPGTHRALADAEATRQLVHCMAAHQMIGGR